MSRYDPITPNECEVTVWHALAGLFFAALCISLPILIPFVVILIFGY